mgnify:CR=1 FL=1
MFSCICMANSLVGVTIKLRILLFFPYSLLALSNCNIGIANAAAGTSALTHIQEFLLELSVEQVGGLKQSVLIVSPTQDDMLGHDPAR